MGEPTSCCRSDGGYCDRCDLLLGLEGLRVVAVDRDDGGALTVTVESAPGVMGCRACGVVALGHGRLDVHLVDAPAMGRPVRICWRKRRWLCPEPACPVTTFVEQDERVAAPRAKLTTRACRWAINQLRREHASIMTGTVLGDGVGRSAQQRRLRQVTVPAGGASEGWSGAGRAVMSAAVCGVAPC